MSKRQKTATTKKPPSRVFSPFRSIGVVTNHVPFAIGTLGSSFYIVTIVGRSFQIFDAATLRLLFLSQNQTQSDITCVCAHFQHVYVGYDTKIAVYKRGALIEAWDTGLHHPIKFIENFGQISVGASQNELAVVIGGVTSGLITVNASYGAIVGIVHPATHLNKVVVATTKHLLVYNVRKMKLVHVSQITVDGAISTITSAPVLDVVALGTSTGQILVVDFKKDKVLRQLHARGTVVSLSFRSDGGEHLGAGLITGDAEFFDLGSGSRVHVVSKVHSGFSKLAFLNGQSVFVTNGADNKLKEYVFDPNLSSGAVEKQIVPPPRLLRSRGGHSAPPIVVKFLGNNDHFVLSGSKDCSLWNFSLRKDSQAQEMSQRPVKGRANKPNPVTCVAYSPVRSRDWDDVVTGHESEPFARTWSTRSKRIGSHKLSTVDNGVVSSVCISQCGNFCFVGSSEGNIAVYNLQSGALKKQYRFHKKAVTGIAIDTMNQKLCSVSLDGVVGFYDFSKSSLEGSLNLESPATVLAFHKSSELLAVALDDLTIVVVDMASRRIVRQLIGHSNRITGLDFSPNGRWLVSCALDGTVRTWNVPTGGCIDGFYVDNVVTSVKFSPTGNFLATTHVSGSQICLWNNKSQFIAVGSRNVTESEFGKVEMMPNVSGEGGGTVVDGALDETDESAEFEADYTAKKSQIEGLVTMSSEPQSKYSTVVHLETIRRRNKPKEAPKKPELAPFFLQEFGQEQEENESQQDEEDVDMSKIGSFEFESQFTKLLKKSETDVDEFLAYIVSLSPSKIDLEVRSLTLGETATDQLVLFVKALTVGVAKGTNYEMYEAIMRVLFKAHSDLIYEQMSQNKELAEAMEQWGEKNKKVDMRMDSMVKSCVGVMKFLSVG